MAIWAVCKDPGGTAGVMPVVEVLRSMGLEVLLIANGKSVEMLQKGGETFIAGESAEQIICEYGYPEILITSMCSKGGVGRDLAVILKGKCPVIALQDYWGARLWTDWVGLECRPDLICVNDEVGARIVSDAWHGFSADRIKITGYPALDRFVGYDIAAGAARARKKLNICEQMPVVFFGGQTRRTGDVLTEVINALNELGKPTYLVPRRHPRMADNAPEQIVIWESALNYFNRGIVIADSSPCDIQELIAVADVIVSAFSTVLVEASVLRKPNISVLYPDAGMAEFVHETGGGMKESPIVSLGCSAKAENKNDLQSLLEASFAGDLRERQIRAQERCFRLDGKNAHKVAELVCSFL